MFDALLFTTVVNAHVADDAQAQLGDLGELLCKLLTGKVLTNYLVELLNCISSEESLNTSIAKCDIDEGFKKVGQVLSVAVLHLLGL